MRLKLVHGPTPLLRLPRLADQLGVDLWIKREDANGGVEAGNKLRKLEFLLGNALELGCDTVLTCGALQSNHCRATVSIATRYGLRPIVFLRTNDVTAPVPHSGNAFLMKMMGADIQLITPTQYRERNELMLAAANTLSRTGQKPYIIPEGGSNAIGSLGYVDAMREVKAQLDVGLAEGKPFDYVVHACGSGGTAAGLVLGAARYGVADNVLAFAVCDDRDYFTKVINKIVGDAQTRFANNSQLANLIVDDTAKGPAYGVASQEQLRFLVDLARRHGLVLDPVYVGKAMFGLAQAIKRDHSLQGKRVLFLHTGGLPGLLACADDFAQEL